MHYLERIFFSLVGHKNLLFGPEVRKKINNIGVEGGVVEQMFPIIIPEQPYRPGKILIRVTAQRAPDQHRNTVADILLYRIHRYRGKAKRRQGMIYRVSQVSG